MALVGRRNVRRHISITAAEETRLIAAAKKDRAVSLSHWLASLGLKRADELDIPDVEEPEPEPPKKKPAKK